MTPSAWLLSESTACDLSGLDAAAAPLRSLPFRVAPLLDPKSIAELIPTATNPQKLANAMMTYSFGVNCVMSM